MESTIRIRFGGDIMLAGSVLQHVHNYGPLFPFRNLINELSTSDIFFVNLECTLSKNNNPPDPNKILLHTDPSVVKGLKKIGINLVSLANNHSFDYGCKAFEETCNILNENGIKTVWGGENGKQTSPFTIIESDGVRLAFLACCAQDAGCRQFACDFVPRAADTNHDKIYKNVEEAKSLSDCVIVSVHWGEEFRDYPNQRNIRLARGLIDKGATIIVGHHARVFQGYEMYKSGLIIYDLGSFIFGNIDQGSYKFKLKKRKYREGILVYCEVSKNGLENFNFIPTFINNYFQASIPKYSIRKKILERFYDQSNKIDIDNYGIFYKFYNYKFYLFQYMKFYSRLFCKAVDPRFMFKIISRLFNRWPHTSHIPREALK